MSSKPGTPDAGKSLHSRQPSDSSHQSPSRARPKPQFSKSVQFFVNNRGNSNPVSTDTSPSGHQAVSGIARPSSRSSDLKSPGGEPTERTSLLSRRRADSSTLSLQNTISSIQSGEEDDYLKAGDAQAGEKTKPVWYLFLLTLAIGGLQIAWSVELSNGSPYLLGLGISKSLLALVWIAGPLSGTLVQPYVGIKSDRCRLKWGRRRPFMLGGAFATITSLMLLAWTTEIVGGVGKLFKAEPDSKGVHLAAIIFAVLMIYVLDFSINVIQAAIRAFIVDNAPTHQQDSANAWASRMTGVGNIVGYLFGYVDLPRYLWFFGDTQFKVLCVIASLAMITTLMVSCFAVKERDPNLDGPPSDEEGGVIGFFKGLYHSMRKLPPQIQKICMVQFFAWIGWFPFLFYITTYVGGVYAEDRYRENPQMTPDEIEEAWGRGVRLGTFALLIFALTTFTSSVILPFFVVKSYHEPQPDPRTPATPGLAHPHMTPRTPHTPGGGVGHGDNYFGFVTASSKGGRGKNRSTASRVWSWIPSPEIPGLTLRRAWLISHVLFAVLTWLTFVVKDTVTATALVGLIGIPWAMTNWAPYALIAAEISKRDNIRRGLVTPPPTREGELLASGEDPSEGADQAGVVLGIHNVSIAAPQVIATLVSSIIFKLLQKPRGTVGDDSVAWVLRFGGIAAIFAAYMTTRVGEEDDE